MAEVACDDLPMSNNILHISTYDYGGAGIAAYRLHRNLKAHGFNSKMLVLDSKTTEPEVIAVSGAHALGQAIRVVSKVMLKLFSDQDYYFQDQRLSVCQANEELYQRLEMKPDVIVMHWVSGFMSIEQIAAIARHYKAKLLIYMMDMANLTGGCHYAWDCTGYTKQCGQCPALKLSGSNDLSARIMRHKVKALEGIDVEVVAAASWGERQAKASSLFQHKIVNKLLLPVNPEIFKPLEQAEQIKLKQQLGLPEDKKLLMFGSQGFSIKRKGLSLLMQAFERLSDDPEVDNEQVCLVRAGQPPEGLSLPFASKTLGFLKGDEALAQAYQVADVFICASIEDSGPMMINESVMCGTPVIAFEMGVAPDLVTEGETGFLSKLADVEELALKLKRFLQLRQSELEQMSALCRNEALALCDPKLQVQWFSQLMQKESR